MSAGIPRGMSRARHVHMRFAAFASLASAPFAALVACGGLATDPAPGSNSGVPSSSGASSAPPSSGAAAAKARPGIDGSDVRTVTRGTTFCGASPLHCAGQASMTVDLVNATVQRSRCAEATDGGMVSTERSPAEAIDAAAVARIRAALGKLEIVSSYQDGYDGAMAYLVVETSSGTRRLSPQIYCSGPAEEVISGGLDELDRALGW